MRDRMLVRGLYLPAIAALALAGAGGVAAQRPPRAAKASPHATAPLRFKAIWEPVNYPHDVELDEVLFINADTGFVTGHGSGGVILRTTDGGANWAAALGDPASNQRPFEDLRTDGLGDAFAVQVTGGGDHKLLRSSNGQDWQETGTVPQHRGDYAFVSATTGVTATRDQILRTEDGGQSWKPAFSCAVHAQVNGLARDAACTIDSFAFPSARVGYGLGQADGVRGVVVAKSEDGGQSWHASLVLPTESGKESHLAFTDENDGVACLIGGHLYHTHDGGTSWQGVPGASCDGKPAVQFAGPVGWTAVYTAWNFTGDGGARCNSRTLSLPAPINGFSLPRPDRGYVVGPHGMVYRYRIVPVTEATPRAIAAPIVAH